MKISVLLPVYNASATLRAAVDSILSQEFKDFELLIIDDGSKDESRVIINEYARRDNRIRQIFNETNKGLPYTLNEGLRLAASDLVARLDADDEALPQRLGVQYEFMKANPEIVVAGSYVYNMGKTRALDRLLVFPTEPQDVADTLKRCNCIYHPTVIMRKKEILELGGYRSTFKNAEDYDLWLRASKKHLLSNIPKPLLRYRLSVQGASLAKKWEQLYYAILAQVLHELDGPFCSAHEDEARKRLGQIIRKDFFACVAQETARELMKLGFPGEACILLRKFTQELGWRKTIHIASNLLKDRECVMPARSKKVR